MIYDVLIRCHFKIYIYIYTEYDTDIYTDIINDTK